MSFLTVLTIVFIVLKLTGHIDWSWWIVVSPSILFCMFFVVAVIISACESPEEKLKRSIRRKYGL